MNNPEEIQHFIDVLLKEDSFVKAAKKLYISQPYLTQLIKRIEDRLGTPIIDRDKKPYALTQAGLLYYQYLENISYNKQQLNKKLAQYTQPNKRNHQNWNFRESRHLFTTRNTARFFKEKSSSRNAAF